MPHVGPGSTDLTDRLTLSRVEPYAALTFIALVWETVSCSPHGAEDSAKHHVPDQLEQLLAGLVADGAVWSSVFS